MAGIAPGIPFVHVRPNDEPDVTCQLVIPQASSSEGLECVVQHTVITNGGEQLMFGLLWAGFFAVGIAAKKYPAGLMSAGIALGVFLQTIQLKKSVSFLKFCWFV